MTAWTLKCVLVAVLLLGVASAIRVHYQDVELLEDETWSVGERIAAHHELRIRFALHQRNLDRLHEAFLQVSDPDSAQFHQYWTREQVMTLVSPPAHEQQRVVDWSIQSGCVEAKSYGDYVEALCSANVIESMLGDVELAWVKDVTFGDISPKIVAGKYSLPLEVARVVQFVQNLAMNIHKRRMSSYRPIREDRDHITPRPAYQQPSEDDVIPETLWTLYNISPSNVISTKSSQNVAEFTTKGYADSDLQGYDQGMNVPTPNRVQAEGVSYDPSPPDTECTLDIELITAVGLNATNYYYTIDGWVMDFAQELLRSSNPPMVNSISWSSDERGDGQSYNFRTDAEWQKLGLLGVSVLAASGDDGAVGASRCSGNTYYFNPGYPATSPWVTSVGATMLVGTPTVSSTLAPVCSKSGFRCAVSGTEEPADENLGGYATGGGFSVFETRPSYQNTVVTQYLNDNSIPKPPQSYYNSSNRGFPDVAANGYSVAILRAGQWETVGGTSAATPIWGGIFALMNDLLLKNGKQPLGFANPVLYKMWANSQSTFTNIGDTTTNNDDGCTYGYTSNPNGWDPVTGLGTPNVGNILNYIQSNLASFP